MATWPTYPELVGVGQRAAARTGAAFRIYSGAEGRCRCCAGPHNPAGPFIRPLGPYNGVIRHITAGGLGGRTMESYIRDILIFDTAVPFKCQWTVAPGGTELWLLGVGRANHDLNMSQAARNALIDETLALDQFCQNLRGSELVGSTFTMGIEQVAATAPDPAQARLTDSLCAELTKLRGWNGREIAGHGEVATDRGPGDPNEHMGQVRTRVMAIVAGSTPPPTGDDDLPYSEAQLRDIINSTVIGVFRSPEAQDIMRRQVLTILRSEGANGGGDPSHNGVNALGNALTAAVTTATQNVLAAIQADDANDITPEQVKQSIKEAVTSTLTVPGTLTFTPAGEQPRSLGAPEAEDGDLSKAEAEADLKEQGEVVPGAGGSERVVWNDGPEHQREIQA